MTDNNDDKTLNAQPKKTLTLKPGGMNQGTVRQDMGRGRTNAVVVETRKRRPLRPEDEKQGTAAVAPAPKPAAPAPVAARPQQPAAPAPRIHQPSSGQQPNRPNQQQNRPQQSQPSRQPDRPRGNVLHDLSAGEMEARRRALMEAQARDVVEAKQRAEDEARRKVEEERRIAAEREEAARRAAEEAAAAKAAAEAQAAAPEVKPQPAVQRTAPAPQAGRPDARPQGTRPAPAAQEPASTGAPRVRRTNDDDDDRGARRGPSGLPARGKVTAPVPAKPAARLKTEEERRRGKLTVTAAGLDEDGSQRGRSLASMRRRQEKFRRSQMQETREKISREVVLPETITIQELSQRMSERAVDVIKYLMKEGQMMKPGDVIDADLAELIAGEFGHTVKRVSESDVEEGIFNIADDEGEMMPRPPVVTIMGHVDHGKTRLLDAIRNADVVSGEAGGITQHIGAYQVKTQVDGNERALTFIDTPGHEAFTAMRARGAQVTDIAILVVAADDGVMPQTVEALNHAQAAGVPIVVAVNKVDKDTANPAKIRQQLTEYNLVAEEYGGDTMFVDVSAKQNMGIDSLLEAVVLTADAALDLRANPNKDARGVAIEANLDKGRGAVATVLVQSGTLHVGDAIVAGTAHGRVRAMFDEHGNTLKAAGPARPVMVLGLTSVPRAGDGFLVAPDDRTARQIAEKREAAERAALLAKRRKRISLEDFTQALEQGKVETLNLVLKGDVSGAVEALEDALLKINVGDEVDLRIIHRGVGAITQNDVNLATVDNAIIIGFNVKTAERVAELADREGIDIRYYSIIYKAIEDVEAALKGMLKPEYEEVQLGTAEIREVFRSSKFGNIAGSIVRSGEIRRNSKARVLRDGVVLGDNLTIDSLKRFKDDATEVREGFECGIGLGSFNDLQVGDTIETWEMREKPRS